MKTVALALLLVALVSCETPETMTDHEVAKPMSAEGIDYLGILAKAKSGDAASIHRFIAFSSRHFDGAAGEAYAEEMAELALKIGDEKFNAGVFAQASGLKPRIAENFDWGVSEAKGLGPKNMKARFPKTCATLGLLSTVHS